MADLGTFTTWALAGDDAGVAAATLAAGDTITIADVVYTYDATDTKWVIGDGTGGKNALLAARSTAAGVGGGGGLLSGNWSGAFNPLAVDAVNSTPLVATDGAGIWMVTDRDIANGQIPQVAVSTNNAETFTVATMPNMLGLTNRNVKGIATDGSGNWVLGLANNARMSSTNDGATWIFKSPGSNREGGLEGMTTDGTGFWWSINGGGGTPITMQYATTANVTGTTNSMTETGGNDWNTPPVGDGTGNYVGGTTSGPRYNNTTNDLNNWTTANIGYGVVSIATNRTGVWIATGSGNNRITKSTDNGRTWTDVFNPGGTGQFDKVRYGAGVFFAVHASQGYAYSLDNGDTWALASSSFTVKDVAIGADGRIVAVGDGLIKYLEV